ncbi:MAG: NnrU family protein [Cyclobacteriaceae bacterium]|nr:NnrU family protein [Cyclobacteriaceae bacterium]
MKDYILISAGWATYFALHSLLASSQIKKAVHPYLKGIRYRLFYSVFSTAGLALLLFFIHQRENELIASSYWSRSIALISIFFALYLFKKAFQHISVSPFLGLMPEAESHELILKGIYMSMRHPLYTGTLLLYLGWFFFSPTDLALLSGICLLLYLPIGIYLEERKLIGQHGSKYIAYKKTTPALFPRIFRSKNNIKH